MLSRKHDRIGHARHWRMREGLPSPVSRRRRTHETRIEPVLHVAHEYSILDQNRAVRRRALVIEAQRPAPLLDRSVIDDRDAGRRDPLAEQPGERAGFLAVEIALKAVADRLVQEYARPAGPEHHVHLARRRSDRTE